MRAHSDVVAEINKMPDGPHIGAFFDFDGTLMSGYSATTFIREQAKQGELSPRDLVDILAAAASFQSGRMGFSAFMLASTKIMRGKTETSLYDFGDQVFQSHIARLLYPESRALVDAHLRKGHTVAVVSSATIYQVAAAAEDLNIDHVMCTELEIENGLFTGNIIRPTCFGQGKVTKAEELAEKYNIDMDQSFFYSDSDDDLLLLERVGHPRPLNPNNALTEISQRRGWPIRRFGSRGRPRLSDWIRSAAATASLPAAFAASLPIWAVSGSKRDAQNFICSLFSDVSSALIGLNLIIRGEHHLWSHRPAVFIFNHQSKVDVIVAAKLLRKDMASIGKKEIRDMPIIGRIFEFGGAVLIDRENSANAIEAIKPLIQVMQNENKSLCVFPEGTRSSTNKLGRFKKGAFHIAMQAKVPIVPCVIHNAQDIAPKGDFVMRSGTVEVDILEPIDTSNWTIETLDEHIADVHSKYLDTLDQKDISPKTRKKPQTKRTRKSKAAPRSKRKPKQIASAKPQEA